MANFETVKQYPGWFRTTIKMLGIALAYLILSYGRFILMPLALSALFAMLLEPFCQLLEKLKIGRIAAIVLSMLTAFLVLAGIISLLSLQVVQFAGQLPEAGDKLQTVSTQVLAFFQHQFGIAPERQVDFLQRGLQNLIDRSGEYISTILGTTGSIFSVLGLLPFFIFFMLYYKKMYRTFTHQLWKGKDQKSVESVISNIQNVTKDYILGVLTVITILAVLNGLGLWIIGMDHVLFFAIFSAVLAIIPYIGVFLGSLPAVLYGLLFFDSMWMPLGVIIVFAITQFLEGNFITPNVVGARVSINPFMALVALVIGGQVWGIVGMVLFVPFIGILKCICDEVDGLRPYGYLLGNIVNYGESQRKNRSTHNGDGD